MMDDKKPHDTTVCSTPGYEARGPGPLTFHPFLATRDLATNYRCFTCLGLSPVILKHFEAGYNASPQGFLAHSLLVRLHDTVGRPLGYTACQGLYTAFLWEQDWKKPARLAVSRLVYNWHRAALHSWQTLLIASNPWAVMKLCQAGFNNTVALFVPTLTCDTKPLFMASTSPNICIVMTDNQVGRTTAKRLQMLLGERARTILLPHDIVMDSPMDDALQSILAPLYRQTP